jgi:integrase
MRDKISESVTKRNLTEAKLRDLLNARTKEAAVISDGTVPGLSLRLGPHSASWSLRFRVRGEGGVGKRGRQMAGKQHRVCLGDYPAMTLHNARAMANSYLGQAKQGVSAVKALEAGATSGGLTVGDLGAVFMEDYVRMRRLKAERKYQMAIDVGIKPHLGGIPANLLTRDDVRAALKKVTAKKTSNQDPRSRPKGGVEAARTFVTVLRKMLNWGIEEGKIKRQDNPASGMAKNLPKKRKGERVLSLEEIRVVWRAAASLGYPFAPVYQQIMLTGDRRGAWGRAKKSQLDLRTGLLVVSADDYKSDRVHIVPLVPQSVSIMDWVLASHPCTGGEYLFSGTDGVKWLQGWSRAQERILSACLSETGETMRRWTPHDLRRTVASRIAEALGIEGERFLKRVLDHADGTATEIYNRYSYVRELREVLSNWAAELTHDQPAWSFAPYTGASGNVLPFDHTRGRTFRPSAIEQAD